MTKKKTKLYELTDEHRAQLKPWADKWIANAMSTEPMTDEDRRICTEDITAYENPTKSKEIGKKETVWEVRRQREWSPEGWRRVVD